MKRFIGIISTIFTALLLVYTPQTYAASFNTDIWDGLRTGSNLSVTSSKNSEQANVYAALGDSVGAGAGLPASPTATARDKQCGRSPQGYPALVAKSAGLPLVNATCSGAKVGDIFTKQSVDGPNIPAQLDTAFAYGTPKVMSITAGANDAHWQDFLRACYSSNCATKTTTTAANAYLRALQLKLYYMFYAIESRSNGTPPPVYITGYYNPLSSNCSGDKLTSAEITWLNAEVAALNQTIKNVSGKFSFATFVPVNFAGHDICSNSPWVQGLSAPAPFHPTATGQKAIGNAVIRAMR